MPKYIELPQYKYKPSMEEMIRETSDMTYKSPVETIRQQVQAKFEGDVMELIHSYGINVDKDELIKALQYDRDQYRKGFADGCRDRMDKIKAEIAREICEEIGKAISNCTEWNHIPSVVADVLAELIKKFTEEERKDDDN